MVGHDRLSQAQVAGRFPSLVRELETRIDVSLTPTAAERPVIQEVDLGNLCVAFIVIVLRGLSQGLDHDAEGDSTLSLHLLVLRSEQRGRAHEPWGCFALVVAHTWHSGLRREVRTCRSVLCRSACPDSCSIEEAERPRKSLIRRRLTSLLLYHG